MIVVIVVVDTGGGTTLEESRWLPMILWKVGFFLRLIFG